MSKILVVDDEKLIVKGLKFGLEQDGYVVDTCFDGEEALNHAKENDYDMIILDVMLPKIEGLEVCQQIREFSSVPIIMLTAKGTDMDKIMGLEYGADDYLTKPFNILELKARIKAILRRQRSKTVKKNTTNNLVINELELDLQTRILFMDKKEINLTSKEFDLLELLMVNRGKVYSREDLLKLIWGTDFPVNVRIVDVHMRRLREKIEKYPSEPTYIHTKWGVGYYFR